MMPNISHSLLGPLQNLQAAANKPMDQARTMEPSMYTSDEIFELEREKIFKQQWLCAGRIDSIPKSGDYLCYDIDNQPVVIIRQSNGSVSAFANVCRHRMMTLLKGQGNCKRIVCPYHAWTYKSDGKLMSAPMMKGQANFDPKQFSLIPIRCEIWLGWIYVTLSEDIAPVAEKLKKLEKLVAPYQMENYVQVDQQDSVWDTNWKLLTENFMEGYHLPVTHRATVGEYFRTEDTQFPKKPDPSFTYQTFVKTGKSLLGTAHKDNKRLRGKKRLTSILPTIFPSHMFSLAPDHFWYLSLQPQGIGKVKIRYGLSVAPEVLAASDHPETLKNDIRVFLDAVNLEDKEVVEGIYRGVNSPLSKPGPLCWLEHENHEFTQYISRTLSN